MTTRPVSRLPLVKALADEMGETALAEAEVEAVRHRSIPAKLADRLSRELLNPSVLSEREVDVLALTALGYKRKEIAERLHISHWTVESHRKRIREKLGARSTAHAVALALVGGHLDSELLAGPQ